MFNHKRSERPVSMGVLAGAFGLFLGGCAMPNSSNPTLTVSSARVGGDRATLELELANPSDMDVRVKAVEWSLIMGPLPVADGSWEMGVEIPSKGTHTFTKQVAFSSPPLDPGAGEVELTGRLDVETVGDTGEMSLKEAGFSSRSAVRR